MQQASMDNDLTVVQQITFGRLKGIHLRILSDDDAEKMSAIVVGTVNEVSDAALGLPTQYATECATCGAKNSRDCEGHFGLIKFPFTILNPYYMSEVSQILNKICPGCKTFRHSKTKNADSSSAHNHSRNCRYCSGKSKDGYPKMTFRVSSKDVFAKSAIIAEVKEILVNKCSSGNLAYDYWDVIPKDSAVEHAVLPPNRRVLLPAQVYNILKDVCPTTLQGLLKRKNSIFLNSLLVTPNSHRVREFGQRITIDELTRMYRKLVDFRGSPNELTARVLDRYKLSKIRSEKVSSMQKEYERQSLNDSASSSSALKNIKELVLAKRTDNCFRMVVVGDPRIRVDEIGLPSHVAENMLIADHINLWNWDKLEVCCDFMLCHKGNFSIIRNGERITIWSKDMLRTGDSLRRPLIDGDIVLVNRPPSIHQHSLIALSVKILPTTSVVSINPLICSPFRGDFDGDCLHGYVPQSVNSRVELQELVSLDKQLVNGQSGRNLLSLAQDSLTAAHLILEDGVILNKTEIQQLQMFSSSCMPILPALIDSASRTNFWTGKQVFGHLLPPEFSYASNAALVMNGEALSSSGSSWLNDTSENLYQCLVRDFPDRALGFFDAAQEVLCEWIARRGLSVSLADLYLSDQQSRKNLLDEIFYGLQEAKMLSDISSLMVDWNQDFLVECPEEVGMENLLTEQMLIGQQTKAEIFQASVSVSKSVVRDIQNLAYKYSSKNNSFIAMLKAGSKGNLAKLFQQSLCLGLQHTLAPVSFSIPRDLSCASWNYQKGNSGVHNFNGSPEVSESYIPCALVSSSFLAGLNPLENFVLSLTARDSSFSGHADVSGTITRRIMYFMRDIIIGYDGTVRSSYGNQVVQFNYCTKEMSAADSNAAVGGHPVGALAACAISEAAYSALDQPVSALEPSPLLAMKKILECGVKKNTGYKSASLFLSRALGRWTDGLEYGTKEVKSHLECIVFSDVVSETRICYSSQTNSSNSISPWVCHFHINKEVARKRQLQIRSVINALYTNSKFSGVNLKINLPKLQITSRLCSEADICNQSDSIICISVSLIETFREFSDLDILRDMVMPVILQTVIKGFREFKKVDILWKDDPKHPKFSRSPPGKPFLRVVMSEYCERTKFWSILKDKCLPIRNIIDWKQSHPDDILDISEAYGVDAAWQCFVTSLHSAISGTGKPILPEHLILTANCLSATGEFVPLNAKGLALQRKEANVHSPFNQGCLSNPSDCFLKAAKMGQMDGLQGSLEALAWGQTPPIGTGCRFDIVYNGKGHIPAKNADVYSLLSTHAERAKPNAMPKQVSGISISSYHFNTKGCKTLLRRMVSQNFSMVGIQKISQRLKRMLKQYPMNSQLTGEDRSTAIRALQFHPQWKDKIGSGVSEIKVGRHPEHKETCFFLVRTDGTEEDFSYNKCIRHALEIIAPEKAKGYRSRKENVVRNQVIELD
ncbi:hypothetical protein ABFS83_01G078000 [Erythranthe nasuta]